MPAPRPPTRAPALLLLGSALTLAGCGSPNRANISLRKEVQSRDAQIVQLKRDHDADRATIAGLNSRSGAAAVPTLPQDRLDRLFTVHGIKLARLSGGSDLDPSKPGDEGLKLYISLIDQTGDEIKSSGSFVVEAFDLAAGPGGLRVGRWEFPLEQARANWHSFLMRYEYVLTAPWQDVVPRNPDLTVKVTFNDELTGRQFTAQQAVKIHPPPATQPSTPPSPSPARPPRPGSQPAANSR